MANDKLVNAAAISATALLSPTAALQLLKTQEALSGIDISKLSFTRNNSLNEVIKEEKFTDNSITDANTKDRNILKHKNRVGRPSKIDSLDSNAGVKHLMAESIRSNARNTTAIINANYDLTIAKIKEENKRDKAKKFPKSFPTNNIGKTNQSASANNVGQAKQEKVKTIVEKIILEDGGQGSNSNFSIGDYKNAKNKIPGTDLTVGFYHEEVLRKLTLLADNSGRQYESLSKIQNYNKTTTSVISSKKFLNPNMRKDERASSIYNNESDIGRFFNREASVGRKLKEGAAFNRALVENEKTTFGKIIQVFENPRFKASLSDNFISLFSKGKTLEEKDKSLNYKDGEKADISLTTIIPGLLSRILSAISKNEETFYDWRTGSFKTAKTLTDESIDASRKEVAELRKMEEKSRGVFGLNLKFLGADQGKNKDLIKQRIAIESRINSGGFGLEDNKGLEAFASENFKKGGSAGSEISKITEMFKMQKTFPNLSMIEIEDVTKNIPSSKERNKKLIEYSIKRYKDENPEDSPAELAQAIKTLNKKNFSNVEIVVSENLKDAEENYELYAKLLKQADSLQALEKIRVDILAQVNFLSGFAYSKKPKAKAIKEKFKQLLKDIENKRARIFQGEDFTLSKSQKASFAKQNTSFYDSSAFPEKDVGIINEKFKTLKDNITFNFDEIIAAQRELISLTTIRNVIKETKDSIAELFEKDVKRSKKNNFDSKGFRQESSFNNSERENPEEKTEEKNKSNKFNSKWETLETRNKREIEEKSTKLSIDAFKTIVKLPTILKKEVEKPITAGLKRVGDIGEDTLDYTKRKDIRSILWSGLKYVGGAIAGVASSLITGLGSILGGLGGILAGALGSLGLGLGGLFSTLGGKKLLDLMPSGFGAGMDGKKSKGKMQMPGGAYDENGKPIKKQGLRSKLNSKIGMKSIVGAGLAGAVVNYAADNYMEDGLGKDLTKTAGTALEYASIGATVGSIIPGLGTAVGAAIGAGVGAVVANWDKITQMTGFTFFGKDAQYDEKGNIVSVKQKNVISRMTDFLFGSGAEADENGNITSLAQSSIFGKLRDSIFGSGSITTSDGQVVQAGQTGLIQVMAGGLSTGLKFLFGTEEEPGIFTKAGQWFGVKIDEFSNSLTSVKDYVFGSEESPGIFTRVGSWFEDKLIDFSTGITTAKDYVFGSEETPGIFQKASDWFFAKITEFGEVLVNLPTILVDGFKTVSDKLIELPDMIGSFLSRTFDSMQTKLSIFADELPNIPGRIFDWFGEQLSGVPNWIKDKLGISTTDEPAKDKVNRWTESVRSTEFQLQNKNLNPEERSKLEKRLVEFQQLEKNESENMNAKSFYSKTIGALDSVAASKTPVALSDSSVKIDVSTGDTVKDNRSANSKSFGLDPSVVGGSNSSQLSDVFNMTVDKQKVEGLNPTLLTNLKNMGAEFQQKFGRKLTINSAFRSPEYQNKLFQDAVAKYGSVEKARKWVALPGNSMHNYGYAVDIQSKDANDAASAGLLEKYGLTRPVKNEDWHVELNGIDRAGIRSKGMAQYSKSLPEATTKGGGDKITENEGTYSPETDGFTSKSTPNSPSVYTKTQMPGSGGTSSTANNKDFVAKPIQSPEQVATAISGDPSLLTSYAYNSMKIQEMMLAELKGINSRNGGTAVQTTTPDYSASNASNTGSMKTVGVSNITVNQPPVLQQKQPVAQPNRSGDYNFSQKSISEAAS